MGAQTSTYARNKLQELNGTIRCQSVVIPDGYKLCMTFSPTKMLHQDLRLAWSKHRCVQRSKGQCRRPNSVLVDVSCLQCTNEKGRFATEQVSHLPSTRMINQETSVVAANMAKRPILF